MPIKRRILIKFLGLYVVGMTELTDGSKTINSDISSGHRKSNVDSSNKELS